MCARRTVGPGSNKLIPLCIDIEPLRSVQAPTAIVLGHLKANAADGYTAFDPFKQSSRMCCPEGGRRSPLCALRFSSHKKKAEQTVIGGNPMKVLRTLAIAIGTLLVLPNYHGRTRADDWTKMTK